MLVHTRPNVVSSAQPRMAGVSTCRVTTRCSTRLQASSNKGHSLSSMSDGRGRSLGVGSFRPPVPVPKSSGAGSTSGITGSTSGASLSLSRDGHGIFVGSSRGGGGGGGKGGGKGGNSGSGGSSGDGAEHPMRLWTYIFAAALAAGGAFAFFKKGSMQSLGVSASGSLVLVLCARAMVGASAAGAARVAFGLTLLLGITMANRFTQSKKIMPAGLVAGLSLCMSMGYLLVGL